MGNYLEPKLFFAEITLCRNYHVLELSLAGTILCRNYLFLQLFLANNHFHLSSFGPCKFWAPCACPLVWAKKSPYHCSTHKRPNRKKLEKCIELSKFFQIFLNNVELYLIISSISCIATAEKIEYFSLPDTRVRKLPSASHSEKTHHKIEQKYRIFTNIHRTPPWIFYLVNFVHACAENFETTDDVWSGRALLWNDVKQILRWDSPQFWIQHVPIWEHPLEYSILSISCLPVQKTLKLLMMLEATGCYCEMTLNKFCFGIANNSESNMFQYGNTPLNILSCQFRACLCRKLWNYWWCLKQQGAIVKWIQPAEFMTRAQNIWFLLVVTVWAMQVWSYVLQYIDQ